MVRHKVLIATQGQRTGEIFVLIGMQNKHGCSFVEPRENGKSYPGGLILGVDRWQFIDINDPRIDAEQRKWILPYLREQEGLEFEEERLY